MRPANDEMGQGYMLDVVDTTLIQTEVRKAMVRAGASYIGGYHGPDHTGRFVHDLTFDFPSGRLQVVVKPIETHDASMRDPKRGREF